MVTPQAVGIKYLKTKERRKLLMTLVFMISGFTISVCVFVFNKDGCVLYKEEKFCKTPNAQVKTQGWENVFLTEYSYFKKMILSTMTEKQVSTCLDNAVWDRMIHL